MPIMQPFLFGVSFNSSTPWHFSSIHIIYKLPSKLVLMICVGCFKLFEVSRQDSRCLPYRKLYLAYLSYLAHSKFSFGILGIFFHMSFIDFLQMFSCLLNSWILRERFVLLLWKFWYYLCGSFTVSPYQVTIFLAYITIFRKQIVSVLISVLY